MHVRTVAGGFHVQVFVFPDTNVFLHFQFFDEVDWPTQLGTDEVTLVLTQAVLSELDEHKWSGTRREKLRAQKVLKRLDALGLSATALEVRAGVHVMALDSEPGDELFAQHRLAPQVVDDRLIASILEFKERAGDAKVLLLTDDTGLRIKARGRRLEVVAPPESLRSDEEPDEVERELERARRELAEARSAVPDLRLTFEGGVDHLHLEWRPFAAFNAAEVAQLMANWRSRHPHVNPMPAAMKLPDGTTFSMSVFAGLPGYHTAESAGKANAQIDRVAAEYEAYVRAWPEALNACARVLEFGLVLENAGTAPADDVDVRMTTAAAGQWIEERPELPQMPALPPPRDPFGTDFGSLLSRPPAFDLAAIRRHDEPIDGPNIAKYDDAPAEVHWTVRRVKHHVPVALPSVYFQFHTTGAVASFAVDVRLVAANMRKPRTARLHVEIVQGEPRQTPPPGTFDPSEREA